MSAERTAAPGRGEAGHAGEDVRSDVFVAVELADSGGIRVELTSIVGSLYGKSIRETAERAMSDLGVDHAAVRIDDTGALPFTLTARIEAAARAAGVGRERKSLPDAVQPERERTPRKALRRSRLYLPGSQPKFMINAGLHGPDAVILDLEDSVHPNDKPAARLLVRNALRCIDFTGAERMVRINQLPLGLEDLDDVVPESPDLILIPKVERAGEVEQVAMHIAEVQRRTAERGDGSRGGEAVWLMPILESALGVENAFEIAAAADTVVALTVGLEDYTADLGVPKTLEGKESLYARTRLVNAAKAAGVQAIDSVFGDIENMEGLLAWGIASRGLGFEGMGCIHPRQIPVIHEAFAPTAAQIDRALKIVAAFEEAEARGLGVVSLGTRMVDPPVVLRAQRLVDVARRTGLINASAGAGSPRDQGSLKTTEAGSAAEATDVAGGDNVEAAGGAGKSRAGSRGPGEPPGGPGTGKRGGAE